MTAENLIPEFQFYLAIRGIDIELLQNAPENWRDIVVEYTRSKQYSGLLRNVTDQLKFVKKGAFLLRQEYANYRSLANVNLLINRDTRQPYNTFKNIYTGKIDFSKKNDSQTGFTVGAKTLDYSQQIDAYDSTPYSISLANGINLELTGIELTETPQLIFSTSPDFRSNAFFETGIASYSQLSTAPSVFEQGFLQSDAPVFAVGTSPYFFTAQTSGNVQIQGNANTSVNNGSYEFNIYKQGGTLVKTLATTPVMTVDTEFSFSFNFSVNVAKGDTLFFYIKRVSGTLDSFNGVNMQNGSLLLSYNTITPPSMCQALTGTQLFGALLQAMNFNTDNAPNLPVTFQSFLLANQLAPIAFTSSDSVRAAQGTIVNTGDTFGPGIYKVIAGSVTYSGITYTLNQQFPFINGFSTFTGTGVIQKIQSIIVGNVYNIGDSLQAGGTYEVEGLNDGNVTYNSVSYNIGQTFKYVLGQETFSGSDDSMFVKQIALDPQLIISFADFFQSIKSVMGGDCAFGVNPYTAINNTPAELLKQLTGIPFIETLAYVYRAGINQVSLGNVPLDWGSQMATDMMYNTIKIGNNDQQYDAINGFFEVSSTQYYTSPLLSPVAQLNLISPIRFDPYGIETARVTQNDTAASRSDNDTFGIWINTTPVSETPFEYFRPLLSEGLITPIVGVPASYYNYKLSPKTNLLRGSRYLASIYFGMKGYRLTMTGLKNTAMVYTGLDGVRIAEAEPVDLSNLGVAYFQPEYYTFTIPSISMDNNPYADLNFNVNGKNFKAFLVEYKTNYALKKAQSVKVLLTANNDLTMTIR